MSMGQDLNRGWQLKPDQNMGGGLFSSDVASDGNGRHTIWLRIAILFLPVVGWH